MEEDDLYQQQSEVSPSKRYLEHDVFSLLAFLGKSSNQEWKASRALFLFPEEFQQGKVITRRLENFIITCKYGLSIFLPFGYWELFVITIIWNDVSSILAFLGKSSKGEWKASGALFLFPEEFQQGKVIN